MLVNHRRALRGAGVMVVATSVAAVSLAVMATASADPPPAASTTAAHSAAGGAGPAATRSVLLPTGQEALVTGTGPAARIGIHRVPGDSGQPILTMRRPTGTYVVPASALPYLGHGLDRELFNVTRRAATGARDDRVALRMSFAHARPEVAGLKVTSTSDGSAKGYLTKASARTFGRSVVKRFEADAGAHWAGTRSLLPGGAALASTETVTSSKKSTAKAAKVTLTVTAIGVDGESMKPADVELDNVDNLEDESVPALKFKNGVATVKVAAGNYGLRGVLPTLIGTGDDAKIIRVRYVVISSLKLSGTKAAATVDFRTATMTPKAVVPEPTQPLDYAFSWLRYDAVGSSFPTGDTWSSAENGEVLVAPIAPAKVGLQSVGQGWQLAAPGEKAGAPYTYDLAVENDRLDATDTSYTFTAADLATVHARYYAEGDARTAQFLRYPVSLTWGEAAVGTYQDVTSGARRTEYVGYHGRHEQGTPQWVEEFYSNGIDESDSMMLTNWNWSVYRPGKTSSVAWGRNPVAGIPHMDDQIGGLCLTCRGKNDLSVLLVPIVDSDNHVGAVRGSDDTIADSRFRLYLGQKKLVDRDGFADFSETLDLAGGQVTVGAKKGVFKAVMDVDRRGQDARLNTRSHTVLQFSSTKDAGPRSPQDWGCLVSAYNCRVLPVLLGRVNLPVGLNGSLPAGKSAVGVDVARVQHAASSTVASVKLQVRFPGAGWATVKLTATSKGHYTGTLDNTKFAGRVADVRLRAKDTAGSTYDQTILSSYRVAGS